MSAAPRRPTALLLGNYRPALRIAEMLRERDMDVICGIEGSDHCAEFSRYIAQMWNHPKLAEGPDKFLNALRDLVHDRPDIELVIPLEEAFVRLIAEQESQLPCGPNYVTVDKRLVNLCLDKPSLLTQAEQAGVPVAPFRQVDTLSSMNDALEALGYPVVVRPEDSTRRLFDRKAITLCNEPDRDHWFAAWPSDQRAMLIQRKVGGIRHNCYFAAQSGRIRQYLHAIITRTDRFDGSGLAVEGETIAPDPAILGYTRRLIAKLDYCGIGCVQYLVDPVDESVFFLEINPRIAGNHAVPEFCGLDLCGFMIDGPSPAKTGEIRFGQSGVRYSWIAGDLEGLKSGIRRGEIGIGQAASWVGKIIRNIFRSNVDMTLVLRDPLPGIVNLVDVIPGVGHFTKLRKQPRARANTEIPTNDGLGNTVSGAARRAWR